MTNKKINFKKSDQLDSTSDAVFLLGDANESLFSLPENFVKLIITSPPYNIGKEYEDKKSLDEYFETIIPIIKELKRVLPYEIKKHKETKLNNLFQNILIGCGAWFLVMLMLS